MSKRSGALRTYSVASREWQLASIAHHQDISDRFLKHSRRELEQGDLLQASEKSWGAVAHYIKSIAHEEGWPDGTHGDIAKNARKLIVLTDNPNTNRILFQAMNALHVNFHEADLDEDDVQISVQSAGTLIAEMKVARQRLRQS